MSEPHDFKVDDFVTLSSRGGVWRVVRVDDFQGYHAWDHMLHLEWVAGDRNPGRIVKFSSSAVRLLSQMEVVALSSSAQ
jgi:hypothetical protein